MIPLKTILSYFIPHIKKYKWTFFLALILYAIAFALSGIGLPLFYRDIIDIITSAENKVAEEGTHETLLKNKGVYYDFWKHQTSDLIN